MPGTYVREQVISKARHVVVKVGTNSLTDEAGRLDHAIINRLADQIAQLMAQGRAVTLVASGAIGAGMAEMDLPARPKDMPTLQATAAVGQGQLMRVFHDAFARHGIKVAQVLVTRDDFEDRTRYLNIRNTLYALAELKALPILNENDAVAVDEIRFGDNDIISAHVTNLLGANLLILLTNVPGVLRDGLVVDVIPQVDESALALVARGRSKLGSGGMGSKIKAAAMVTQAGEVAVIASAREPDILLRLLAGERLGTVFVPAQRKMSSRRRWIAQASRPAGKLFVDDGAARAIAQGGKSLLPSGITAVAGTFPKGATVSICTAMGKQIARGLTNYSSKQIEQIKGLKTSQIVKILGDKPYDEVIHRNNMTLV